jgi:hypothetical protein
MVMLFFIVLSPLFARGIYQSDKGFLLEVFLNNVTKSNAIFLTGDLRKSVETILGHPYASIRIRYWRREGRSAWILEEVGKMEPITFGIVIKDNKIEKIKVLAFRERRGSEIRYRAFTQQFVGVALEGNKLNKNIDGISGATLSVWAMKSIAKLSLYLDQHINKVNEKN